MATLPNKAKPSKVVSKDKNRPMLAAGYVRHVGDQAQLETCDSYKLAITPVGPASETAEGFIPADALKAAEKVGKFEAANGKVEVTSNGGMLTFERPDLGNFPNTPELLPNEPPADQTLRVGINAKFLLELAQAFGERHDTVTLTFNLEYGPGQYLKAIRVSPHSGEGVGVLMPVRTNV